MKKSLPRGDDVLISELRSDQIKLRKQIQKLKGCLRWAVGSAIGMRGCLVGNPDKAPLAAYDKKLRLCQKTLKQQ